MIALLSDKARDRVTITGMRFRLSGLALVFALVGCSAPGEFVGPDRPTMAVPAPTDTQTEDWGVTVVESDDEVVPSSAPSPIPVPVDPELVASMDCEPLSAALLEKMRADFGRPNRAVQVKVGEGLNPGQVWWVVVLDSPADFSYEWEELRPFLTTAPGVENLGKWINLAGGDPWRNVKWDSERLVRGQSALTKAQNCLND